MLNLKKKKLFGYGKVIYHFVIKMQLSTINDNNIDKINQINRWST